MITLVLVAVLTLQMCPEPVPLVRAKVLLIRTENFQNNYSLNESMTLAYCGDRPCPTYARTVEGFLSEKDALERANCVNAQEPVIIVPKSVTPLKARVTSKTIMREETITDSTWVMP